MTAIESRPRATPQPSRSSRVVGYAIAVAINALFIWLVNVEPGWRWVPFLTDDFTRVVGLVSFSFVVSIVINLVYIAADPPWVKRPGDALTAAVACVVMLRLFQVFPFAFNAPWTWAEPVFRVALVVGAFGAAIAVLVNLVLLARDLAASIDRL